eukprot:5146160-Pleurochrysis_carterae.AAC.1
MSGSFVLVLQEVNRLESSVVVHHDERITLAAILRWDERSGDVHMDEPSGVTWRVQVCTVRQSRGIGCGTSFTGR